MDTVHLVATIRRSTGSGALCFGRLIPAVLITAVATGSAQAKKSGTIPCRPRNGTGNCREARVRRIPPGESVGYDRDRVPLALVFTDKDGAGFQA
jgi:hypothetical protein